MGFPDASIMESSYHTYRKLDERKFLVEYLLLLNPTPLPYTKP